MSKLKVNELDTESGTTITVAAGKTIAGTDIIDTDQITDNAVDTAQIASGAVGATELDATLDLSAKTVTLAAGEVSASEMAATLDLSGKTVTLPAASVTAHVTAFDDNQLKEEIALLGFRTAANGSLAKYNLVDQTIDAFEDASGIDASASTNELRNSNNYVSGGIFTAATGGTITTYSKGSNDYKVHTFTSGGNFVAPSEGIVDILAVGGGSSGGYRNHGGDHPGGAGGGGAGGFTYFYQKSITAGTYAITVGTGMTGANNTTSGTGGYSQFGSITPTALGGGRYTTGGSGSGANYGGSAASGTLNQGWGGGPNNSTGNHRSGGGGGGASALGNQGPGNVGGHGGDGYEEGKASAYQTVYDWNLADGTMVEFNIDGTGNSYAGGGGGYGNDGGGAGGAGGGGTGRSTGSSRHGVDGTGGGGGGGGTHNTNYPVGDGGDGIVIVRYGDATDPNPAFLSPDDLTLVSTSTTSEATPTKGDLVMTYSDGAGTASIGDGTNGDIRAFVSRDDGTTYTQFTLADEGDTGGHIILTAHDLDISAQPSGTSMRYKITTHNQSASKETRIQAVSLGWS